LPYIIEMMNEEKILSVFIEIWNALFLVKFDKTSYTQVW